MTATPAQALKDQVHAAVPPIVPQPASPLPSSSCPRLLIPPVSWQTPFWGVYHSTCQLCLSLIAVAWACRASVLEHAGSDMPQVPVAANVGSSNSWG